MSPRRAALQGLVGTATPPTWPDGPALELVLAVDDGATDTTWYADGTVPRIRLEPGEVQHAELPSLLAALSHLRGNFAAPPDEA